MGVILCFSGCSRISLFCLCGVTLALSEYLHNFQSSPFPWGLTPTAQVSSLNPHSLWADVSMWVSSWLKIAIIHNVSGEFPPFCLIVLLLMFLSFPWPYLWRDLLLCRSFSYFRDPSPGQGSTFWNPLSPFLSISFALPYSREFDLPLWTSGFLCQFPKIVLWELFHIQMIFWCFCQGEGGLPILFLCHLEATTVGENLKELVGSYTAHWNIKCISSLRNSLSSQFLLFFIFLFFLSF